MSASDRWSRVEALYHAARERDAGERDVFLDSACKGDAELRREVESLLAQPTSGDGFLREPAVAVAGQLITNPGATVLSGRRIGAYQLQTLLGAGGMGEVYRARDTKLGRDVAIKILPSEFTSHPERLARFQREARVLASLNHPNIGAIYGIEDGPCEVGPHVHALVLELVEGQTLAERIARGAVPIAEALGIARQIADALDVAHEKGIIHRDLKPANIKITPDGVVKVLDFGLAKAVTGNGSPPDTQSPTVTVGGTRDGIVLGTAAYMSPEQARGLPVDKRTDIWAFGCVLYEALTGRVAFAGDTISDTIASILEREPNWQILPATPSSARRLLRRCLEKDPKRRLHDIADARIEVDEALSPRATTRSGDSLAGDTRATWRRGVLIPTVLALGVIAGWGLRPIVSTDERALAGIGPAEVRFQITTPPTTDPVSLAISPDGRKVVFVAGLEGRSLLWLRSLDDVSARPLAGTEDAALPFWSPDSEAIAFFADRQLKRIDLQAGTVQALAPAAGGRGGAWNKNGMIVFQPSPGNTPLVRVAASGGEPVTLTGLVGRFPQFLPDDRHFIYYGFYGAASFETRGVYVAQLDGLAAQHLIDVDGAPVYASSGHLMFVRQGTLVAQRFDAATLRLTGEPFPVTGAMTIDGPLALAPLSASAAGLIAYRQGSAGGRRQFVWFDRSGKEIEKLGDSASNLLSPVLSPDGRRVALHRVVNGNGDIWLLETGRGVLSRFTTTAAAESHPVWSPDGTRLVFASAGHVLRQAVAGGGTEQLPTPFNGSEVPDDWSPDGRFLLYELAEPNPSRDIWALPLLGGSMAFPVVQTKFDERDGQFSPDGKWIAYTSDESGRPEVYVQPFSARGARSQISVNGGGMARWRRDGAELFYIALDGRLMAVTLRSPSSGETALDAGAPIPLFATRIGGPVQANSRQQYMVSADGQHFLMNTLAEENASPITVILNWKAKP